MQKDKKSTLKVEKKKEVSDKDLALLKAKELLQQEADEKNQQAVKKLEEFMKKELPDFVLDIKYQILLRPRG